MNDVRRGHVAGKGKVVKRLQENDSITTLIKRLVQGSGFRV
jgi:hypothetical protein